MKKIMLTSALLGISPFVLAENLSLEDVVVTAARIQQPKEHAVASVSVIPREQLEKAGQSTLVEVLRSQPGIEFSSNGGAGKTTSVFIRGTNADHVVVLIDGMRVNSATLGTTAFENLPVAQIERIEILRGPAASLYGQDAIGGVIQIFTKRGDGPARLNAAVGLGSYNTKQVEAGVSGKADALRYALRVSSTETDGFSAKNFRQGRQSDNDGYRNLSASANVSFELMSGHEVGANILSSEGHNQYDSSTTFDNYGDISQLSYQLFSKHQWTDAWKMSLRAGEGIDDATDHASASSRSRFQTKQRQYALQNDIALPVGTLTLLYERLEQRIDANDTDFARTERNNDGYTASYVLAEGAHDVQLSYRSDHNTQFGNHDTGAVGYGYHINDQWRISGNYGTAFKAPTFNQLYFPFGVGNPNIRPESSRNAEISVRFEEGDYTLTATAFRNHIRDLIDFDFATFSFNNTNRATIKGLELLGQAKWGHWHLNANATLQSPREDENDGLLARRAQRHGNLQLAYVSNAWRLGSELVLSSHRFNETANTTPLAGYGVLNLTSEYQLSPDWAVQARWNNVFDKQYTLAYDTFSDVAYNTPGSNLFVSLRYAPK